MVSDQKAHSQYHVINGFFFKRLTWVRGKDCGCAQYENEKDEQGQ
jgi:hypothetical protein